MGREVEGGFRMGNTCTPMANSCFYILKCKKKKRKENRMRYLNTWLPEASLFFFWLFVLELQLRQLRQMCQKEVGTSPFRTRKSWFTDTPGQESLEEVQQSVRPSWRQLEMEAQNPLFLGEATPAHSVRRQWSGTWWAETRQGGHWDTPWRGAF